MILLLIILFLAPLLLFSTGLIIEDSKDEVKSLYTGVKIRRKNVKQLHTLELEFPGIVELFTILVTAGLSPSASLLRISEAATGEFSSLLRDCVHELRHGSPLTTALEMMTELSRSPLVRRFNDSIIIAMDRGTPLTYVLSRQVEEVRQAQRTSLLEKAGKAEIALMVPVVFMILPVSVLFALWPSYFALGQSMGF
jgi:tight adherence protein C